MASPSWEQLWDIATGLDDGVIEPDPADALTVSIRHSDGSVGVWRWHHGSESWLPIEDFAPVQRGLPGN